MARFPKKVSWDDIAQRDLWGRRIILDVDGVLMADGETTMPAYVQRILAPIIAHNEVVIVSNSPKRSRCRYVSETLGIPWINTHYRKPFPSILKKVHFETDAPLVVIGDKVLTDGLFAHFINAEFLMLERRTSVSDSFLMRLNYAIEDALYACGRWLVRD